MTFRAGDKCVVSNWAFRYLRTYRRHGRKNGAVVADRVDRHESVEDELLRYYGGLGEHRALRPSELRSIQLLVGPRHDGIDGFAVSETRVLTERFTDELRPFAVAGSSHPLMLVPDARHYWRNDYEDDPARVRGVSVHLVGDFSEGCPSQGYIDLTSDRHALARTPIRIEFPSQ